MAWLRRWLGVLAVAVVSGLVLPGAAWASQSPGALALAGEVARRRRGVGGIGLFGTFCCLGVVALVVLAVLLIIRRRRPGGR